MSDITEKKRPDAGPARGRPQGKREQTKATNREAILNAAREVFSELGYGETTVRDIIRQTGLASGTFYNYFKSKEEVFEALMDESALRIRPRLRAERIRSRSFEEYLRNAIHTYFEFLAENRQTHAMMRRNTGALRVRMDTPEVVAGFEEIRSYIEEDIAAGRLKNVDGEYLTAAAVGTAIEIGDRMIARENPDVEAAAEFAAALLLNGISALPAKDE